MRNEKLKRRRNVFVDIPCIRRYSSFLIRAILLSAVRLLLNADRENRDRWTYCIWMDWIDRCLYSTLL